MTLVAWCCIFLHVTALHGHLYRHGKSWNGYDFHTYPHPSKRPAIPRNVMVDVINDLGLKLLAIHNEYNENNIAISPYGALSVLMALGEGLEGEAVYEIQQATHIPKDISVIRVGLRDIHRHLKSYFIPKEGFLAGLTLNHENVTLRPEYEQILRFYGYDTGTFNNALYPQAVPSGKPQTSTEAITTAEPETTTEIMRTGAADITTEGYGGITTSTETTTLQVPTEKSTVLPETTTNIMNTEKTSSIQQDTTTTLPQSTEARILTTTELPTTVTSTEPISTKADVASLTPTTIIITTTELPATELQSTTSTMSEQPTTEEKTTPSTFTTQLSTQESTLTTQLSTQESASEAVTTTTIGAVADLSTIQTSSTSEDLTSSQLPTSTNQENTEAKEAGTTIPISTLTTNLPSTILSIEQTTTNVFESTTVGSTTTNLLTTITESDSDLNDLNFAQSTVKNDDSTVDVSTANVDISTLDITTPINIDSTTINTTPMTGSVTPVTFVSNPDDLDVTQSTIKNDDDSYVDTSTVDEGIGSSTPMNVDTTTSISTNTTTVDSPPSESTTDTKINEIHNVDSSTTESVGFGGISKRRVRSDNNNDFPFTRKSRSVVDYLIARYYDDQFSFHNDPPYVPEDRPSFLVYGKYREYDVNFMKYNTVLPFHYAPHLNALALSFPLDSTKYYLLLLLPVDEGGIDKLICDLRLNGSIKYIIENLQYRHVIATIPSFKLKGYVTLTPSFQKLGIRRVFEPRQADFAPLTNQSGIYVTNIEQSITVTIRNYVNPETIQGRRHLHRYDPMYFKADHPFLYFVIDSDIHVTLMAGKIVNPLNSRIS